MRLATMMAGALLVITTAACSGGDGGGGSGGDGGVVLTMLATVPDTASNRSLVEVNDYGALAAAAGQDWPPAGTGSGGEQGAVSDFVAGISAAGLQPSSGLAESMPGAESWRTELGFTIFDVTADVRAGNPPETVGVYRTGIEPGAIADAVRSDPVWSGDLSEDEHAGATLYLWADPLSARADRTSGARRLGQGGALGVTGDGLVVRAVDPDTARATLDTVAGDGASLADDATYAGLARALDGQGAYSAVLSDLVPPLDPSVAAFGRRDGATPDEVAERLEDALSLPPYLALGIGEAVDNEGQPVEVLVFATTGPDVATDLVDRFETIVADGVSFATGEPWSQRLSIRSATTDDSVAIVVVEPASPGVVFQAFSNRDSLLVAGP